MRRLVCVAASAAALAACGGGGTSGSGAPGAAAGGNEGAAAAPVETAAATPAGSGAGSSYTDRSGHCSITVPDGWVDFNERGRMDPARHEFRATVRALNGAGHDQAVQLMSGMTSGRVLSDGAERTVIQGTIAGTTELAVVSNSTPVCSLLIAVPTDADMPAARAIADSLNGH